MTLSDSLAQFLPPDSFARQTSAKTSPSRVEHLPQDYQNFILTCWNSYANGLLRFLLPDQAPPLGIWNDPDGWGEDWGPWRNRYFVFGYDWQARLLAFDLERVEDNQPLISMLDTGTGKTLNSKASFRSFIEDQLPTRYKGLLDEHLLADWLSAGGEAPLPHQCVGYKVPLFLGGKDEIENSEITDINVYVPMQGQFLLST